jgi:hypothetical protein
MKNNQTISKDKKVKIYKTVEEALNAKHEVAQKFIAKVGVEKIAAFMT